MVNHIVELLLLQCNPCKLVSPRFLFFFADASTSASLFFEADQIVVVFSNRLVE